MSKKTITYLVIGLVVIAGVYFFLHKKAPNAPIAYRPGLPPALPPVSTGSAALTNLINTGIGVGANYLNQYLNKN